MRKHFVLALLATGALMIPRASEAGPLCGLARKAAAGVSKVAAASAKGLAYLGDKSKVVAVVDKTAQAVADFVCKL